MSKILEKVILARLKSEGKLEQKLEVPNENQYGFREKRSTVKQLLKVVFDITNNLNMNLSTAALLLDIEKAFDAVWNDGLILKLKEANIPIHLIKIISSFLTDRNFAVKVGENYSTNKQQKAGVPQGSILGPILYIIYNRDMPSNEDTKIGLFADETAIYSHSKSKAKAVRQIKEHAEELHEYFTQDKIKTNPTKTEFIIFYSKTK